MSWVTCPIHGVQWIRCEECPPVQHSATQIVSAKQLVAGYWVMGPHGEEHRAFVVLDAREDGTFEVETPRP